MEKISAKNQFKRFFTQIYFDPCVTLNILNTHFQRTRTKSLMPEIETDCYHIPRREHLLCETTPSVITNVYPGVKIFNR